MRVALLCIVLLLLVSPVLAQSDDLSGCAIYNATEEPSAGITMLILKLVDWYPMRAMLYDGTSRLAIPPSRFFQDVGDTGASNWSEYPVKVRIYDDLEPGTYTAVFAGISGGFTYDFEIEANTRTTATIECM